MVQQMMLRSFLKSLVNLTRRRVSHGSGLIRQASKHQALSFLQKNEGLCGFCDDQVGWLTEKFQWHFLLFNTPTRNLRET